MNATESALICRFVRACCPQQKFDEYTPDAWFELLGDLPFGVAKVAAREVAKRHPFVAPAEIRDAVIGIRSAVSHAVRPEVLEANPEPHGGDDEYRAWHRRVTEAVIALTDQRIIEDAYALDFDPLNDNPFYVPALRPSNVRSITR